MMNFSQPVKPYTRQEKQEKQARIAELNAKADRLRKYLESQGIDVDEQLKRLEK